MIDTAYGPFPDESPPRRSCAARPRDPTALLLARIRELTRESAALSAHYALLAGDDPESLPRGD